MHVAYVLWLSIDASTITLYERGDPTATTVGPVEFEKWPVQVQDIRQIANLLRRVYRIYHKIKENQKISTCNRLHFETPGSRSIKPNLSPGTDNPSVPRKVLEQEVQNNAAGTLMKMSESIYTCAWVGAFCVLSQQQLGSFFTDFWHKQSFVPAMT